MKKGELLSLAIITATTGHNGQYDKQKQPYILHPLKVMHYLKKSYQDEELMCIALLHDIVEDTELTISDLKQMGFTDRICQGIYNLTKYDNESEDDYKNKVKSSLDSVIVKLADIRHNTDIRRSKSLSEKHFDKLKHYYKFYVELTEQYFVFTGKEFN